MKQTPLYGRHVALGAKVIDFGGWAMPVQYSGILDEHKAVREGRRASSTSHTWARSGFAGRGRARPSNASSPTTSASWPTAARCTPAPACRPAASSTTLIVYRESAENLLIVCNASNVDKDFAWFKAQSGALCEITNLSDETGLLAVQGPRAVELVQSLSDRPVSDLKPFTFRAATIGGVQAQVARTGYTGEDGFELFAPATQAGASWDALLGQAGPSAGLKPIGLGARDTLRLEASSPLRQRHRRGAHAARGGARSWVVKGSGFVGEEALGEAEGRGPAAASSSASS